MNGFGNVQEQINIPQLNLQILVVRDDLLLQEEDQD